MTASVRYVPNKGFKAVLLNSAGVMAAVDEAAAPIQRRAASMFGAEQAKGMAAQAREHKAGGGKFCFCAACSNGADILAIKDQLL